ncbi:MAG: hypothetical protein O2782_23860, partial [bacterium]|nr:hypothetical protein [bacterium]
MQHLPTQVTLLFFALLHLLGWYWPAELWGVDQLYYYGPGAAFVFVSLTVWSSAAGDNRVLARVDRRVVLFIRRAARQARYVNAARIAGLLTCLGLAYVLRVRAHLLGDSDKW